MFKLPLLSLKRHTSTPLPFGMSSLMASGPALATRHKRVNVDERIRRKNAPRACVTCAFRKVSCDAGRPCVRCIKAGKEDTCVDVETKRRRKVTSEGEEEGEGEDGWEPLPPPLVTRASARYSTHAGARPVLPACLSILYCFSHILVSYEAEGVGEEAQAADLGRLGRKTESFSPAPRAPGPKRGSPATKRTGKTFGSGLELVLSAALEGEGDSGVPNDPVSTPNGQGGLNSVRGSHCCVS